MVMHQTNINIQCRRRRRRFRRRHINGKGIDGSNESAIVG